VPARARKPLGGVLGVGIDLVEIEEFAESIVGRPRMLARVFTPAERAACKGPSRLASLAARFAAKEAAFKAVGTGWSGGVTWLDVEVVGERGGRPTLEIRGGLAGYARAGGGGIFHVSLTHSGAYSGAVVIWSR
jgi:holo-[acyl-carrier protein] synthase